MQGVRFLIAATSFFCLVTNYAIRVNLNVAIVAMVNSSNVYKNPNKTTSNDISCPASTSSPNDTTEQEILIKEGEFAWSPATQGIILGSFYYGYCCFQIIGGRLAEIYSGKWVLAIGTFIASFLAVVTPIAARHSVTMIVIVRALQGVSQSAMLPAMYSLFGRWFPDFERGTLGASLSCGMSLGTLLGMSATGVLCDSDFFDGWPSAFYTFGCLNFLMTIFWCLLVTNSPATHPLITKEEFIYISSNQKSSMEKQAPPIPWRKVLTSVPVWALVLTQVGSDWCFYIVLNDIPTFFNTVLHFDLKKDGILSSAPYPLKAAVAIIVGFTADALLRKGYTTKNFIRKFCTAFAFLGFSVGLIGICLAGCDALLSTVFFMCALPIIGFDVSGYAINHLDLSSKYAGTLYGIANTFSSLMGFAAPMFVGYVTNEHQSMREWYTVFGTVMVVLILISVLFCVFGSTEEQDWIESENEILKETAINCNAIGTVDMKQKLII